MSISVINDPETPRFVGRREFVTGGGHVYPLSGYRLTIFRGHLVETDLGKRRDSQAIGEGGGQGGEKVLVYKKIVSRLQIARPASQPVLQADWKL